MYLQDRRPIALLYGLLSYLSLIRAQPTDVQTIFSLDIFSSQKLCAQACFTTECLCFAGGCYSDIVGDALGCVQTGLCYVYRESCKILTATANRVFSIFNEKQELLGGSADGELV